MLKEKLNKKKNFADTISFSVQVGFSNFSGGVFYFPHLRVTNSCFRLRLILLSEKCTCL